MYVKTEAIAEQYKIFIKIYSFYTHVYSFTFEASKVFGRISDFYMFENIQRDQGKLIQS